MANLGPNYLLRNYLSEQKENKTDDVDEFALADVFNKTDATDLIDAKWVIGKYGISDQQLLAYSLKDARYFSTASYKYSNTKLGGHISINPKPQYLRYCDIRPDYNAAKFKNHTSVVTTTANDQEDTMGRYYSEAIDDNAKLIYLTFGTKRFNGLLDYFFSAVDYGDSIVANTGRLPLFYNAGKTIGSILVFSCFPITTLLIWGIKLVSNLLTMNKSFDYYYMQPTMHTYWASVNTIATHMATELGLINPLFQKKLDSAVEATAHSLGLAAEMDPKELEQVAKILGGGIFDGKSHFLDIYAVVVKPQLRYLTYVDRRRKALEQFGENSPDLEPLVDEEGGMTGVPDTKRKATFFDESEYPHEYNTFQSYLDNFVKAGDSPWMDKDETYKIPDLAKKDGEEANKEPPQGGREDEFKNNITSVLADNDEAKNIRNRTSQGFRHNFHENSDSNDGFFKKMKDSFMSAVHDGANSLILQVEYMGSVSESFSNDTGEIQSGSMLKAAANGVRDMKFSLAGGNMGMGFNFGEVIGAVKDFAVGGLNSITFGLGNVISTLLGDQYIDMPKMWTDSSVLLSGAQFTIKLRTPYGNVFSRYQNLYIPLACILAGTLPLSAGPASYTSPFLCSMNCQGIANIKLGMITSLQITRGTSNLPFTHSSSPLGIDINFTVTDFSNIVTAPVSSAIFADIFQSGYDDEGPLGRYIATLAGRDIQTFKYYPNKLGRRLARINANIQSALSPYRWGVGAGNAVLAPAALFVQQANFTLGTPGLTQK